MLNYNIKVKTCFLFPDYASQKTTIEDSSTKCRSSNPP